MDFLEILKAQLAEDEKNLCYAQARVDVSKQLIAKYEAHSADFGTETIMESADETPTTLNY